ncbi:MAG: cytochrome P450 [Hyphomonadaceae bacterium]|nr:MAG: cytochrome P450 family protein [Caulobacteraceae bacterium]MBT9445403.1 cytochrome P450 [Hyphomonadaceae bacterium]TPW07088.1 MAG: cytochrome P450 family protein [Alphaproteobacteria bacterium]
MTEQKPLGLLEMTPLNPAFRDDQQGVYDRLRSQCPVHRDEVAGEFLISRHADVRATLADRTLWRGGEHAEEASFLARRLAEQQRSGDARATSILTMDDPDHSRIRPPIAQALYARVAKCKPEVERIVEATLAKLEGRDRFDVLDDYAVPIPIDVIASILGVDHDRLGEFREWSEGVIQFLNPLRTEAQTEAMTRAGEALGAYMHASLADRRRAPKDDLITDLVRLQADGAPLTDDEIAINLEALLVGGNLTTTDLIGNAIRLFLLNPAQRALLLAQPELIASAVEETLRYEPPVDITGRIANRDIEVGGCPIRDTQAMIFMLRAANRDPDAFPDPHRFDIARKGQPHVSFGGGAHICIGAPLARLEAQSAILKLLQRFPNLQLADSDAAPQWRTLPFFHGLEHLDVRT